MPLLRVLLCLCLLTTGAVAAPHPAGEAKPIHLAGKTLSVIDGDTFQAGDIVIHLAGVDAPELGQVCDNAGTHWPCGMTVAYELRKILSFERRDIVCFPKGAEDGAMVASCTYGNNDIARTLLLDGSVIALPGAPQPYLNAQSKAKEASLGIWRGHFVTPWNWRTGERLQSEPAFKESHRMRHASPWKWVGNPPMPSHQLLQSACLIKAVHAKDGKRIYLTPLDRNYEKTPIDQAKGDLFFCSDEDARQAGWRRPGEKAAG